MEESFPFKVPNRMMTGGDMVFYSDRTRLK
jgi:hypothetical protein